MDIFKNFKKDLPASLIVFLVAVPLCLGIALASEAPMFAGIIAGIIGGIVVGMVSGSQLGVSGPAAGLAVIVAQAIKDLGTNEQGEFSMEQGFPLFLAAVVIGGVIQIILGFLKAGVIGYFFPNSVIKGMLAGIGVIIISKQIPHAFGYDKDVEGDLNFVQPDGETTLSEFQAMIDYISPSAMLIAGISLFVLILWEQKFMKKMAWTSLIQGPLVAVVGGIAYAVFTKGTSWELSSDHLVNLPVAGNFTEFSQQFTLPNFAGFGYSKVWITGGIIALVASLETLLCVEATDKLDPDKRITPTNRELIAQGTGNLFSGLIGGLPITQVIVRSSTNIQSGGKTKLSAILHGVLILISVSLVPNVLNLIPLAVLAAILIVVGYKLAKPTLFKQMYKRGFREFVPFLVTVLGLYFTDMLTGIGLGMAVAIFLILLDNYKTPYYIREDQWKDSDIIKIELAQEVSFINKVGIQQSLDHLPENSKVVIDASKTLSMHPDVFDIIEDFKITAKGRNIDLEIQGLDDTPQTGANAITRFKKAMGRG